MATTPAIPAGAPAPPSTPAAAAVAVAARPGWTTSEFWTTNLVHLMGVIATVLVLLGDDDDRGLQLMEAAVPILALAISGILSFAYSRSRARVKLHTIAGFAEGVAADLAHIAPLLERDARLAEPVVAALDPAVLDRLHAASQAYRKAAG